MHVEIIYALPLVQHSVHLELDEGATIAEALRAVERLAPFAELKLADVTVGVFGSVADRSTELNHGDRLEIYRPLELDPMEARRRRASRTRPVSR